MATPYENALSKSFLSKSLSDKEMPLDKFQREQSIFSRENPYSAATAAPAVEDLSGPIQPGMVESGKMTQQQFDTASRQAGGANEAIGAGADALIMFGDPTMKAVGLGLKTVQGINQAQQQNRMNKYNAELNKMRARQDALNRLAQIGQGLKA